MEAIMEKQSGAGVKQTKAFRYAIGMFGTSIPINMFKTYAAIYYVDSLGLSTRKYSLIIFLYTFIDAIDNPIYGFLSDRTRTPWGRRRPWLVLGAPLLVLFFILFFNPPAFSEQTSLFVYMLLMYILTGTLDSLVNANYGALFPELFDSDAKRAKTNSMRQAFQLIAMIVSIAMTPVVTKAIGYHMTAVIYGVLALTVILYSTFGCHELPQAQQMEKPTLLDTLKALVTNKKFWIFGAANAFYSVTMALVMQAVPFFVKYSLHLDSGKTTILLGVVLLVAISGVLVWVGIIKKLTLIPAWRTALIILGLAFVPLYFAKSLIASAVICCIIGFGFAGAISTMDLIGARIMDEDTKKFHVRREGIYSSAMGMLNKSSGLFVSLAFLLVYNLYGFESGANPGTDPDGASRFLMIVFPICAMLLSSVFSFIMHFDRSGQKDNTIKAGAGCFTGGKDK
jgi:GPH family glycoside/pentoside/hexuronide:cation symporter